MRHLQNLTQSNWIHSFARNFAATVCVLALAACATPTPPVIVPQLTSSVSDDRNVNSTLLSKVDIRLVAAETKYFVDGAFGDTYLPVGLLPKASEVVAQDLRAFFAKNLGDARSASKSLTITIEKADCFFVMTVADKVPLLGLALFGRERKFQMNLRLTIEVEVAGKVISTYSINESISSLGSARDSEALSSAYLKLIAAYREKVFEDLRTKFAPRYL